MERCAKVMLIVLVTVFTTSAAMAEDTRISVYVKSRGAKFVGTSMGGARVEIRDARTDELLSEGVTSGSTGDTELIMKTARKPGASLTTPDTADFTTTLDITRPRLVTISAWGPVAQRQAAVETSTQQWIIPGKHIVKGNAITLDLLGFAVDVQSPSNHIKLKGTPQTVSIQANITMICGCPIEPDGLWDPDNYEIEAIIQHEDDDPETVEMEYAGQTSQFETEVDLEETGTHHITVYAFDPENGNAGVDHSIVIVQE
ncbi:MAG: hypothetical protein ACOC0A_04165 [Planctomycetota bacterium]